MYCLSFLNIYCIFCGYRSLFGISIFAHLCPWRGTGYSAALQLQLQSKNQGEYTTWRTLGIGLAAPLSARKSAYIYHSILRSVAGQPTLHVVYPPLLQSTNRGREKDIEQ